MYRWILILAWALLGLAVSLTQAANPTAVDVERGRQAARGRPQLNPPNVTQKGYETAWKQWGLAEKPADYDGAFRERYGLHPAPYDNGGLPMGLHPAQGIFGKGIGNDCLLCHASAIAGQTILGLGNASLDLQGLFEELFAASGINFRPPFQFSTVRGSIDPISPVAFLSEFREPDLTLRKTPIKLDYFRDLCSEPPAWWLLKKKKTRNWTGSVAAGAMRTDMVNLLTPLNSAEHIKKQEPVFAAMHAFVLSVEAPRYPFPIDATRAAVGHGLFKEHCARCHGTYGPSGTYPNKIVPLDTIGTDPALAEALSGKTIAYYNESWFAQECGPDGNPYHATAHRGYQAPPLDGVWATAPYLHNGSVPTVYHLLNSRARPKVFTRSYRTDADAYDPVKLGWKFVGLDRTPDAKLPGIERRRIYDTTQPGRGNGGHPFGDELTEDERWAVIEYLKTL